MVKRLKELRQKKNISQQQLAEIIGVSQQSINKYENHSIEPDIATLIRFADYFNTSVDYLIGNSDTERKNEAVTPFDLNIDEAQLINSYRTLTEKEKASIRLVTENYSCKK